ncbi:hypothetical protein pipiens_012061 [Culex pipiens pipiens]|uniref:Gustatory receptor n=1 Tax=Culex pipiens pipiens TaxID=38569 RepID=A0ABD1D3Y0_CULPP
MDNFRSLFLLTHLFGFNVRSFRQSGSQIISSGLSRSGTVLFLVNASTYLYFASQNKALAKDSNYLITGSELLDVGGHLMLQTSYVTMFIALVGRAARQRQMGKILNQFVQVDRRIRAELGVTVDYDREWRLVLGIFGIFLTVILIAVGFGVYCLYLLNNLADGMIFYGGQIFVSISGLVLAYNTFIMIFLLHRRVCLVQRCLRHILTSSPQSMQSNLILFKAKEQIRPTEVLHLKISQVALIFDDLYNLSLSQSYYVWTEITSYLGIVVSYGLMTLFATYRAILTGHFESIVASSMYLVWWAEYCLGALVILSAGHLLELVSRRTVHLLGLVISSDKVRAGLEEIKNVRICSVPSCPLPRARWRHVKKASSTEESCQVLGSLYGEFRNKVQRRPANGEDWSFRLGYTNADNNNNGDAMS